MKLDNLDDESLVDLLSVLEGMKEELEDNNK